MKTYNDFFVAQYANQLHTLEKLGAKAEFVVQDYGTLMVEQTTINLDDKFVNLQRRVELRVTMTGSWYALRWSRDWELLNAFDMDCATSMAERFVADIDSLVPLLKERVRYIRVADRDILEPISQMDPMKVYRGSQDIWDIQALRRRSGSDRVAEVLDALAVEEPGLSFVSQLEQLYRGSRITGNTSAMSKTVMFESLVRTHIDHIGRHIYDVQGYECWQFMVSYDEDGIVFCPTYGGEMLEERGTYPSLYQDGLCRFTVDLGGESRHSFWQEVGCSFAEFDAAQRNSDPLTVFRRYQLRH